MNKQQLASKIWESANKMRSKIEANEYKDYILGFIFYKFLSEKEEMYLDRISLPKDERKKLVIEENKDIREDIQNNIGYFISYNDLYSTWISKKSDFDISDVRDALNERILAENLEALKREKAFEDGKKEVAQKMLPVGWHPARFALEAPHHRVVVRESHVALGDEVKETLGVAVA